MKKLALLFMISIAATGFAPQAKADINTIKLARALVATGVVTVATGQLAKWAYDSGYFKSIAAFCKKNPWYPVGGALIGTGAALLWKDAVQEFLAPIGQLSNQLFARH